MIHVASLVRSFVKAIRILATFRFIKIYVMTNQLCEVLARSVIATLHCRVVYLVAV